MKKVLLSLAVAAASLTASAQTVTVVFENNFNEPFTDLLLIDGDGDGDDVTFWQGVPDNVFPPSYEGGMIAFNGEEFTNGYQDGATFDDNIMITAELIAIPASATDVKIKFDAVVYEVNAIDTKIVIFILDENFEEVYSDEILLAPGSWTLFDKSLNDGIGNSYYYGIAMSDDTESKNSLIIDNLEIYYDVALGVNELNNGEFAVYPNPAVNELTIANTNALAINTVNVLDITGKTVKTFNFNGSKVSQTVSIADLNTGVYFVQVNATEGTSVLRVAKK